MTLRLHVAIGLGCLLLAAPAAYGKGGGHATLDHPERLRDAAAGERVAVAWTLSDEAGRPFGADGINLRVRRAADGATLVVAARAAGGAGRFVADLTIPAGGLDSIAVGLEGIRTVPGHAPVRGDMIFPVVNAPLVAARRDGGDGPPWGILAGLGVLTALAAAAVVWSRNRDPGTGAWSARFPPLDQPGG